MVFNRGVSNKQTKFQWKCLNFDKMGHNTSECKLLKKKRNREGNMVEDISKDVSNIIFLQWFMK